VAIRFARRVRPLFVVVAMGAALAVTPTLAAAAAPHSQPHATPSVTSVQKQLGELALQNSQLVEKFDQAQVAVGKREKAAAAAQVAALQANAAYNTAHAQFTQLIQAQYESGSFGAAGALLDSSSNNNYLDRLQTLSMLSTHSAEVVQQVGEAQTAASHAAKTAQSLLASARSARDALAKQRKDVQTQITKYQSLLATLNSAQQADYRRAQNPSVNVSTVQTMHLTKAGSAAAQRAVQFALAQVGKPYVFGAAGPGSYDCSGLTMRAWQAGGVSLPHSAAGQYNYGHHVPATVAALQPGDLIFFYQPIGHVTIYVGNGLMVSAPTEGENVSVVPLSAFNGSITGATRLT
jgi:Cell wall-associated hydrolases (invasion-associated proteins)